MKYLDHIKSITIFQFYDSIASTEIALPNFMLGKYSNEKQNLNYRQICTQIIDLDKAIRFAGIASLEGKILAAEYRDGLQSLLTLQESELSIMQSLMRMSIRKTLEGKLGKTVYATATYQKVKRATISLFNEGEKCDSYLMVSFEREADHEAIINKKMLPFLQEIGKGLAN